MYYYARSFNQSNIIKREKSIQIRTLLSAADKTVEEALENVNTVRKKYTEDYVRVTRYRDLLFWMARFITY